MFQKQKGKPHRTTEALSIPLCYPKVDPTIRSGVMTLATTDYEVLSFLVVNGRIPSLESLPDWYLI